jgi:hypothetical protein
MSNETMKFEGHVNKNQLVGLLQAMIANIPPARFSEALVESAITGMQTMLEAIPEEKHAEVLMNVWVALLPVANKYIPEGL